MSIATLSRVVAALFCLSLFLYLPVAKGEAVSEYRVKAAFIYNFIAFTEWPKQPDETTLNLCVHGQTPLNTEIKQLQGKKVNNRQINTHKKVELEHLNNCHIVFIASSSINRLPTILEQLKGTPVLTIADSPGVARKGVVINMDVANKKIVFEANLRAAQQAGLTISSKLLRLATEVHQ